MLSSPFLDYLGAFRNYPSVLRPSKRCSKKLKKKSLHPLSFSDCGEWQLRRVCLVIYPVHMSPLVPLIWADHVTIVTTSSHFCHDTALFMTLGTLASVFSAHLSWQNINKSTLVTPHRTRRTQSLDELTKSQELLLFCNLFSSFCTVWVVIMCRRLVQYLHTGLRFLFTDLELPRPASPASPAATERCRHTGWFRWAQTEAHTFTWYNNKLYDKGMF